MAEKLLADWLALLMYGYLIEGAGPAIHLAFRATKRQTEKGPVDVFTGEAKYCLAEDKILRQLGEIEDVKVGPDWFNFLQDTYKATDLSEYTGLVPLQNKDIIS